MSKIQSLKILIYLLFLYFVLEVQFFCTHRLTTLGHTPGVIDPHNNDINIH